MLKLVRAPLVVCLLVTILVSVMLSPMVSQSPILEESMGDLRSGEGSVWTLSPTSGTHTGGTSLTLTTTGLSSYFEDNSWENFTIDSSADVGKFSSIAVDSNGELHISYRDSTNGHLKYASNAGGTWTSYPIDNGGGYIGRYTSIVNAESGEDGYYCYECNGSTYLRIQINLLAFESQIVADDSSDSVPGFDGHLSMVSIILAAFVIARRTRY